jgi:hypothetical protein
VEEQDDAGDRQQDRGSDDQRPIHGGGGGSLSRGSLVGSLRNIAHAASGVNYAVDASPEAICGRCVPPWSRRCAGTGRGIDHDCHSELVLFSPSWTGRHR